MSAKIASITPLHLPLQCGFDTLSFKKWGLFPHLSNLDSELACDLLYLISKMQIKMIHVTSKAKT